MKDHRSRIAKCLEAGEDPTGQLAFLPSPPWAHGNTAYTKVRVVGLATVRDSTSGRMRTHGVFVQPVSGTGSQYVNVWSGSYASGDLIDPTALARRRHWIFNRRGNWCHAMTRARHVRERRRCVRLVADMTRHRDRADYKAAQHGGPWHRISATNLREFADALAHQIARTEWAQGAADMFDLASPYTQIRQWERDDQEAPL